LTSFSFVVGGITSETTYFLILSLSFSATLLTTFCLTPSAALETALIALFTVVYKK